MLEPGTVLGRYRLADRIGEGGMGVVWRARDTSLDRDVAVKVLPDLVAADAERLARFEREAKLLASLNHPNIASVYGLEQQQGLRYLVMELVPGEDLSRRLAAGPLPVTAALKLGVQLARALEAAHENGVIHRDLKPANIQVADNGDVKVLDFGLAKAFEPDPVAGQPTMTPTVTSAGSRPGLVIGTAAYMSPEQARGRELDKRTDIWSFGCVLYECLTGRQTFGGETVSDTLASILRNDPDWSRLPASTPPRLQELLARCLDKDARNRQRDIGDARIELEALDALGSSASGRMAPVTITGAARRPAWFVPLAMALLGAAVGIGLFSGIFGRGGGAIPAATTRVSIASLDDWVPYATKITPDGQTIVYRAWRRDADRIQGAERLFVRDLATFETREIPGSEGVVDADLSADGKRVAFVAPVSIGASQLRLYTAAIDGSAPPVALTGWGDDWGDDLLWHTDGDFVACAKSPDRIVRIAPDGKPRPDDVLLQLGDVEGIVNLSAVSADGTFFFADGQAWTEERFVVHVVAIDLANGGTTVVAEDGQHGHEVPSGHLLFSRRDVLLAAPFDRQTRRASGAPQALESGMRTTESWNSARFDLSATGTLVYRPGGQVGTARQLMLLDENGALEPWNDERRAFEDMMSVSPDGDRFAVVVTAAGKGQYEIWTSEIDTPRLRQFAAIRAGDCAGPVWHPDSRRIAFNMHDQTGNRGIYIQSLDAAERVLVWSGTPEDFIYPLSFSPDGNKLAVYRQLSGARSTVLLDLTGSLPTEPTTLVADSDQAEFSPDGRWLAYSSLATGEFQVMLRRYDDGRLTGPEIPVSGAGGRSPRWNNPADDGRLELWYWDGGRTERVAVESEPRLVLTPLAHGAVNAIVADAPAYDFLPDGRLLVVRKGPEEDYPERVNVVTGALAPLR